MVPQIRFSSGTLFVSSDVSILNELYRVDEWKTIGRLQQLLVGGRHLGNHIIPLKNYVVYVSFIDLPVPENICPAVTIVRLYRVLSQRYVYFRFAGPSP